MRCVLGWWTQLCIGACTRQLAAGLKCVAGGACMPMCTYLSNWLRVATWLQVRASPQTFASWLLVNGVMQFGHQLDVADLNEGLWREGPNCPLPWSSDGPCTPKHPLYGGHACNGWVTLDSAAAF
jgi:hypothetical protein